MQHLKMQFHIKHLHILRLKGNTVTKAAVGGVLWKSRSAKFGNIHKKTPVLESLFKIFKNTYFEEHLGTAASDC